MKKKTLTNSGLEDKGAAAIGICSEIACTESFSLIAKQ